MYFRENDMYIYANEETPEHNDGDHHYILNPREENNVQYIITNGESRFTLFMTIDENQYWIYKY